MARSAEVDCQQIGCGRGLGEDLETVRAAGKGAGEFEHDGDGGPGRDVYGHAVNRSSELGLALNPRDPSVDRD